jgi:hypothetical protein
MGVEEDQSMQSSRASSRVKVGSMPVLPQPVVRLVGVLFIGLGAGLYTAAAPLGMVVVALVPAVVAVAMVIRSSITPPC